jgi:hypothetical protein
LRGHAASLSSDQVNTKKQWNPRLGQHHHHFPHSRWWSAFFTPNKLTQQAHSLNHLDSCAVLYTNHRSHRAKKMVAKHRRRHAFLPLNGQVTKDSHPPSSVPSAVCDVSSLDESVDLEFQEFRGSCFAISIICLCHSRLFYSQIHK